MLFSSDTSPEAREQVLARLRRMTPAQRFAATAALVEFGMRLARQGAQEAALRLGDPGAERREFLVRWLGAALATEVLAWEARSGRS